MRCKLQSLIRISNDCVCIASVRCAKLNGERRRTPAIYPRRTTLLASATFGRTTLKSSDVLTDNTGTVSVIGVPPGGEREFCFFAPYSKLQVLIRISKDGLIRLQRFVFIASVRSAKFEGERQRTPEIYPRRTILLA